jgi:hypothetical protein
MRSSQQDQVQIWEPTTNATKTDLLLFALSRPSPFLAKLGLPQFAFAALTCWESA